MEIGTFYPDSYHIPVCLLLVFCKLYTISLVVFYLANSERRQLPPQACYWLRPCQKLTQNKSVRHAWSTILGGPMKCLGLLIYNFGGDRAHSPTPTLPPLVGYSENSTIIALTSTTCSLINIQPFRPTISYRKHADNFSRFC